MFLFMLARFISKKLQHKLWEENQLKRAISAVSSLDVTDFLKGEELFCSDALVKQGLKEVKFNFAISTVHCFSLFVLD